MHRQPSSLVIVSILAVVCAVITLVMTAVPVLCIMAALPLILFLPGYAIMVACLPQRSLDRVARLAVSLGLSIAITILVSLLLYWLHLSLQTMTWAIALAATTLVAAAIAWRRQPAVETSEPLSINLHWREALLLALAVLISGVAIGVSRLPTPTANISGYTSLWMITARDGNTGNYELGITSQEFNAVTYHLQVIANGQVVQDWPELKLVPGEAWTGTFVLPSDRVNAGSIEAVLYRQDDPGSVYRRVTLQHNG